MASYEIEHGIAPLSTPPTTSRPSTRRPDMSTFFTALSAISTAPSTDPTSPSRPHNNPHATPTPAAVRATYLLAADGLQHILADAVSSGHSAFLEALIRDLHSDADAEAPATKGVSQEFIDGLERVPKKHLKKADVCPICAERFLDDPYPLVVQLPCHPAHRFDLECIAPWVKLQGTCPLDRKVLEGKRKEVVVAVPEGEEEEDWDDMIA